MIDSAGQPIRTSPASGSAKRSDLFVSLVADRRTPFRRREAGWRPYNVGSTPRELRSRRRTPIATSRSAKIACDTTGCETPSSAAMPLAMLPD